MTVSRLELVVLYPERYYTSSMSRSKCDNQGGFTVPELLVSVVMLIGLAIGAYYILRPADFGVSERNATRMIGVAQIMRGLHNYYVDNGVLPDSITTSTKVIGSDKTAANLCSDLVPKYMKDIPLDPAWGLETAAGGCGAKDQQYITSYLVRRSADGKILYITAPMAEGGQVIRLTRSL